MDLSIDLSFEKNFILNVMSYIFAKNKIKITRLLMEIMNECSCSTVYLFPSEIRQAVDVIMKAQEQVFKFLTKECIDFYYKKRISSEKAFLEFTTFCSRIALLDTIDNPEAATETYHSMMDFLKSAKQRKEFTFNQDKIIFESKKITGQGLEKYLMYLIDEGDRMHAEATAIVSESPREAYLVSNFEKVKTKIEIGDKASGSEFLDDKKTKVRERSSNTQTGKSLETESSKSEKCVVDIAKEPGFVDVELSEAKGVAISPGKKVAVKGLSEIVATRDLETVVVRKDENDLVQELLEAMEDINM